MTKERLRVMDLNTPWFWFTIFYEPKYGEPYLTAALWKPHTFRKWWLYVWKWEEVLPRTAAYQTESEAKPEVGDGERSQKRGGHD